MKFFIGTKRLAKCGFIMVVAVLMSAIWACSAPFAVFELPWLNERNVHNYEYAIYDVVVTTGEIAAGEDGYEDTVLARGEIDFEASMVGEEYLIESRLTLNFLDGSVGTAQSSVAFDGGFMPIRSHKVIVNEQGEGYEVSVNYGDTTVIRVSENGSEESEVSLSKKITQGAIDNESMLYAVRGINMLEKGYQGRYEQFVGYDYFKSNKKPYRMFVSCASEYIKAEIPQALYAKFVSPVNPQSEVDCVRALISIDEKQSGPSIAAYYSADSFNLSFGAGAGSGIQKVMIKAEIPSHNDKGFMVNLTTYTLRDYSIIPSNAR